MVDLVTVARLVGGVVLLLANGFFVTTEFAMTRIPQFDPAEFQGHPGLERALEMTERLEIYLSGCQVGITVSSVGLGVVAEPAASAVLDAALQPLGISASGGAAHSTLSVLLALGVINILHVIIGEQAPTYLGVERSKFVAKHGARPLYYWTTLMAPVIRIADWAAKAILGAFGVTISRSWTEEELEEGDERLTRRGLRREIGEVLSRGPLPEDRREEVLNALRIGERPVAEVMTPVRETVALSATEPAADSIERMAANPQYGRFPLFDRLDHASDESVPADTFLGTVYASTVLTHIDELRAGEETLRDISVPPMTVDPETTVATFIDRCQQENRELAAVVDDRAVVGIVTATDAFEAVAGQLEDPMDSTVSEADQEPVDPV